MSKQNWKIIKPLALKKGDTIGIVSPAAPLAGLVKHRVDNGIKEIRRLGFKPVLGKNSLKISNHTAGTSEERANDINAFFKDKEVKAIFTFIGGNHSNQLLKYLDFTLIKNNPKIFLGYSDTTVLDLAIFKETGLVTFYGPAVLTQFAENPKIFSYTERYLNKAIIEKEPIGAITASKLWTDELLDWFIKEDQKRPRKMKKNEGWHWIKNGTAKGPIIGGCITSLMHLRGTKYWPDFKGAIFFWEIPEGEDPAKGEDLANIDSYLADLELSGVFHDIKGMIVGRPFGYKKKDKELLVDIIKDRTMDFKFPILFNIDVGHSDPIITVPIGVEVLIDSLKNSFIILEQGTI